ncbi:hypothetical protein AF78_04255 [Aliarcobacter butzleri L353]|nr:hypothetical protein AF78_04255 [Aliarcobacter butzleri L353]
MKYLYKKNKANIYKRRIPYSDNFFTFNLKINNVKNAQKFVIIFNRLSRDLWDYLKLGKNMAYSFTEILEILEDYKQQATKEYIRLKTTNKKEKFSKNLEELRHEHLKQLFPIKKDDPIMGEITLSGGDEKVLKTARKSFKNLAIGDYTQTKAHLKQVGKDIVKRGTDDLKKLYAEKRNSKDEKEFLDFLSLLLKTEAQILKEDEKRAKIRFGNIDITIPNTQEKKEEIYNNFIKEQKQQNIKISQLEEEYLSNYCSYTKQDLENSKTEATKTRKVINILTDLLASNKQYLASDITLNKCIEVINIIPKIPVKVGNIRGSYSFYEQYIKSPNETKENLRNIKTINGDLRRFNRYIGFLVLKEFLTVKEEQQLKELIPTQKRILRSKVKNNEIKGEEKKVAWKDEMLEDIFSFTENNYYKIILDKLKKIETFKKEKDILMARFYAPLLMFFTGSRLAEVVQLKVSDCEIRIKDKEEQLFLYIEANEQKGSKTQTSKRILYVHSFLSYNLNLINYVKKAQLEKREYLFNTKKDDEDVISKAFNRYKDSYVKKYLSKEDEFFNTDYTMYCFRHTFKTHMLNLGLSETLINEYQGHKDEKTEVIRGYFTVNNEIIENIEKFEKHLQIKVNWDSFIELSKSIIKI